MSGKHTRRRFLQLAGTGAAANLLSGTSSCLGNNELQHEKGKGQNNTPCGEQLKLGLASYTLRKFNLDETLKMTHRVGLKYIAFKSFHLPLESSKAGIKKTVAKVKEGGLKLYGGGVIYMKNKAAVIRAFEYAKAAGMEIIIGVPNPELLDMVNEKVKEYDIKVAIHNHGPGDKLYPVPESAYEKIKNLDKRIGLCNDIGHTQRSGVDPSESARRFAGRLLDVHIKDVSSATAEGSTVEIGRGVIDIPKFLRTLIDIKYKGVVSFEYEKDENDPLAGLAESAGYVKGVLAAI